MKKISIITIIIGALLMVSGIISPLISSLLIPKDAASIGIIGGADGPTAIFVTSSLWADSIFGKLTIWGVVALIVASVLLIINKFKKK